MTTMPEGARDGRAFTHDIPFENGKGPLTHKGGSGSLIALLDRAMKVKEQVIDMDDATHTLVVNADATTAQTRLAALYLRVDPASSVASENLVFPAEADIDNLLLFIENTGGEIINIQNDTPATVLALPAGETALITCDGTTLRAVPLSGVGGYFTSIDLDGTLDQDSPLTGTGDSYNNLTTMSHATQTAEAVDVTAQQITNARTAGELVAYKASLVGLAGDAAGATYVAHDLNANDTGGSGVFVGMKLGADFDYTIDSADQLTGENVWSLPTNVAVAWQLYDATTSMPYINVVSTTGSESLIAAQRLQAVDGVIGGPVKIVGGRAYASVADSTTVTNIAAPAAFDVTYTIPANTLKESSVLKIKAVVRSIAVNGADTLQYSLRLTDNATGAQVMVASTAINVGANNRVVLEGHTVFRVAPAVNAAGSSFYTSRDLSVGAVTSGPAAGAGVLTYDTTNVAGIIVDVLCTHSAQNAGNQSVLESLYVEIV